MSSKKAELGDVPAGCISYVMMFWNKLQVTVNYIEYKNVRIVNFV